MEPVEAQIASLRRPHCPYLKKRATMSSVNSMTMRFAIIAF